MNRSLAMATAAGALTLSLGCADAAAATPTYGERVAASARYFLAQKPATARRDCSGLVEAILARAGARVRGNARTFWQEAQRERRVTAKPRPGDLAIFDRTWDANHNGKVDDLLTHVAVVIGVDADGTVSMVHRGSGQIRLLRLNLRRPGVRRAGDEVLNDFLRSPGYGPTNGRRLAGQLLRGFARPPRPRG
jgi:cell wall-associated NlpC family hydrolase